jgi:hypothetical protein
MEPAAPPAPVDDERIGITNVCGKCLCGICGCEFIRTVKEKQSAAMPSNSKKCRQYDLHYIELANGLTDADQRRGLLRFAATWAALAAAIERAQMINAENVERLAKS